MIIMGIDPGYAIVGYGIVKYENNRFTPLKYGSVTTPAGMPLERRLEIIYDELTLLQKEYRPEAMAVEQLFFQHNQTTAMSVAMARGVILLSAQKNGVPFYEYTPMQIKLAVVGYGNAEKKQVMEMTKRLLNLEAVPKPDDTADALAVAICHGHSSGSALSRVQMLQKAGEYNTGGNRATAFTESGLKIRSSWGGSMKGIDLTQAKGSKRR